VSDIGLPQLGQSGRSVAYSPAGRVNIPNMANLISGIDRAIQIQTTVETRVRSKQGIFVISRGYAPR
jgi:hypothetical protein